MPITVIVSVRRHRGLDSPRARIPQRHQKAVRCRSRLPRHDDPITRRYLDPRAEVRSLSSRRYSHGFRPNATSTVFPCSKATPWVGDGDLTWLWILDGPDPTPYLAFEDDPPVCFRARTRASTGLTFGHSVHDSCDTFLGTC